MGSQRHTAYSVTLSIALCLISIPSFAETGSKSIFGQCTEADECSPISSLESFPTPSDCKGEIHYLKKDQNGSFHSNGIALITEQGPSGCTWVTNISRISGYGEFGTGEVAASCTLPSIHSVSSAPVSDANSSVSIQALDSGVDSTIPIPQITITNDDRKATLKISNINCDYPFPRGSSGEKPWAYRIIWGELDNPMHYILNAGCHQRQLDLQPLVADPTKKYVAYAEAIDSNGKTSLPSSVIEFHHDSARVDALRAKYTTFFEDFNRPAGIFDELKWNIGFGRCFLPQYSYNFINAQSHAHAMFSTESQCERGELANLVRKKAFATPQEPWIEVHIDTDMPLPTSFVGDQINGNRGAAYFDFIPNEIENNFMSADSTINLDLGNAKSGDANLLRFTFDGDSICVQRSDADGLNVVVPAAESCAQNLHFYNNSRTPVDLRYNPISGATQIFVDGILKLDTGPKDILKVPGRLFYMKWSPFGYNTGKETGAIEGIKVAHWDNFGIKSAYHPSQDIVTHNYKINNSGTDAIDVDPTSTAPTASILIPDQVTGALARRLNFTLSTPQGLRRNDRLDYTTARVIINGQPFPYPPAKTNQLTPMYDLTDPTKVDFHPRQGFPVFMNIPDGLLRQGLNTVQFTGAASHNNIHIELDFNSNSAPTFTQPSAYAQGSALPPALVSGPNIFGGFARGANSVEALSTYHSASHIETPYQVTGDETYVVGWINQGMLNSVGTAKGLQNIQILIDGSVVVDRNTNARGYPATGAVEGPLELSKLSPGIHTLNFTAKGEGGVEGLYEAWFSWYTKIGDFPNFYLKVGDSNVIIPTATPTPVITPTGTPTNVASTPTPTSVAPLTPTATNTPSPRGYGLKGIHLTCGSRAKLSVILEGPAKVSGNLVSFEIMKGHTRTTIGSSVTNSSGFAAISIRASVMTKVTRRGAHTRARVTLSNGKTIFSDYVLQSCKVN